MELNESWLQASKESCRCGLLSKESQLTGPSQTIKYEELKEKRNSFDTAKEKIFRTRTYDCSWDVFIGGGIVGGLQWVELN